MVDERQPKRTFASHVGTPAELKIKWRLPWEVVPEDTSHRKGGDEKGSRADL